MAQDQTSQTGMYCRGCDYRLRGLSEYRCPECGRPFDPRDPHTFHRRERELRVRRWIRGIALLTLTLALLAGGELGWLYWKWRAEQPALAMVAQSGGWSRQETIGPAWLARMIGPRLTFLLERTYQVELLPYDGRGAEISDAEMLLLPRLSRLRILKIGSTRVSDRGLLFLRRLPRLYELRLLHAQVTDAGMAYLGQVHTLQTLVLYTMQITDAGLAHLADLHELRSLEMGGVQITDAGLACLRGMQHLERLQLSGLSQIGDEGMKYLAGVENLRTIWLSYTKVTGSGLEYLAGLPRLEELVLGPEQLNTRCLGALKRMTGLREVIIDTYNRQGYYSAWVRRELPNVAASEHLMTP